MAIIEFLCKLRMKKTHLTLAFLALIVLSACEPVVASRGNILDPEILSQIKAGSTTREEVATKLGTPTEVSTFDEKVWYYVGRETEQYSFLNPNVIKQQAVEIDFDDSGIVTSVHNLDLAKAGDISPVDRETPTYGHDNTFIRQLLGDLSHPLPNLGNNSGNGH
jgi:outer membrane protein assembly factor BamE (lipoprotein component of BamABCDE complex)